MKIDILKLAPTLLPFVPAQYRPLAQAAIDEAIERRKREEEMVQAIGRLHEHVNELTKAVNSNAREFGRLVSTVTEHDEKLAALAH